MQLLNKTRSRSKLPSTTLNSLKKSSSVADIMSNCKSEAIIEPNESRILETLLNNRKGSVPSFVHEKRESINANQSIDQSVMDRY